MSNRLRLPTGTPVRLCAPSDGEKGPAGGSLNPLVGGQPTDRSRSLMAVEVVSAWQVAGMTPYQRCSCPTNAVESVFSADCHPAMARMALTARGFPPCSEANGSAGRTGVSAVRPMLRIRSSVGSTIDMHESSFQKRPRSDAELVLDARTALDVRREALALLGEIARAVIAFRRGIVRQVENPPRVVRHVCLRGMRRVAVEEEHVAGLGWHGDEAEALHLPRIERPPLRADEPGDPRAIAHFQATVLDARLIDGDHGGDEHARIARPAGLLVLVRLEPGAARHLEIDLLLEQAGGCPEELIHRLAQPAIAHEGIEARMVRAEILYTLDDAHAGIAQARLAIDHVLARLFRSRHQFIGPACERLDLRGSDETAGQEPALLAVDRHLLRGEDRKWRVGRRGGAVFAGRDVKHRPFPGVAAGSPVALAQHRLGNRSRSKADR